MTLRLEIVNLSWDPVSGSSGYDILLDGAKVANTGPNAKTTKIFIPAGGEHSVTIKAKPSGQLQQARFSWSSALPAYPKNISAQTAVVTA